jgi:hypothetical protein
MPVPREWILPRLSANGMVELWPQLEEHTMLYRTMLASALLLLISVAYVPADAGASGKHDKGDKRASKAMVYVCACMNNKSCSCMTEAKTEGPWACGTQGGPPLKAVPADSDWAKENRDALAQQP